MLIEKKRLQNTYLHSYLLEKLLGNARNPRDLRNIAKSLTICCVRAKVAQAVFKNWFPPPSLFKQARKRCNKKTPVLHSCSCW